MKAFQYLLIAVSLALPVSQAFAQAARPIVPVKRPQGAIPQSFMVDVSVDHENGVYEEGDLLKITVKSSESGYLYLIDRDVKGNIVLMYPNGYHPDNRIEGGKEVSIPSDGMEFDLQTRAPFGKETIQAIVSRKKLQLSKLNNYENGQKFLQLSERDLNSMKQAVNHQLSKTIYPVEHSEAVESVKNDVAECTIKITTVQRGQQTPQITKKRIFVGICVAKYSDPKIPALPACEKDMEAVARFFNDSSAVDSKESIVYRNEEVTREKIYDLFFNYLPNHTNPGDEVIVYWTGHGGRCSDVNGDEKDGFDETLILYDSKKIDTSTQLVDDDFGVWVQQIKKCKVLFILDTCHSGGMANNAESLDWDFGLSEVATSKDLGQRDLAVIASSTKDTPSYVRDEGDMSVMTYFMMEHLKKNSQITHKHLYARIKPEIEEYAQRIYQCKQTVVIQDEFTKPMILNP